MRRIDFGARGYNASIGRFDRVDRLADKYVHNSVYAFSENKVTGHVELDGLESIEAPKVRIYTETEGVGHTFVSVGEGKNTVVYTYGRYAGTDKNKSVGQSTSPTGPGVLARLSGDEARNYIREILQDRNGSTFEIKNADGDKVSSYFENLLSSSTEKPTKGIYSAEVQSENSNIVAKIIGRYELLSNNCTTKACEGVSQTVPGFGSSGPVYNGEKTIPSSPVVIPASMQNYLYGSSKVVPLTYEKIKRELNIPDGWGGKY